LERNKLFQFRRDFTMLIKLLASIVLVAFAVFSAGHALLNKRDPRAALGWIVICLAIPGVGAACYWLLGVNRIRTLARDWQAQGKGMQWLEPAVCSWSPEIGRELPFRRENMASLLNLVDSVTRRPLLQGNRVTPLHNGEGAYPAMLAAIDGAESSVYLSSYIFDNDTTGRSFAQALSAAAERGLDVRIIVDALGERYSFPPVRRLFRSSPKVRFVRFLPPSFSRRGIHLNLRNHRKLLVVDGETGFTGGMNIGDRHLVQRDDPRRVVDVHFQVEGPVVGQMAEAFLEDWHFITGEKVVAPFTPPAVPGAGAFCRGISDGPNEDFEKLTWILIGAISSARRHVRVMTPYFIPERGLVTALNAAVLRGVSVEVILPEKNNMPYIKWASQAFFWEILQYGACIYYQPPPFVHSKYLLVDEQYVVVGSANLDPRSLRLNFEFNLEVYDGELTKDLAAHFDGVRQNSRRITLAEMDARPLAVKLRDSGAKLFSPYL
jgi:cardiolipin synthase A/B